MSTEFVSEHPKGTAANDQERHAGMWAKRKTSIGYIGDQAKGICSLVRECLTVSTWKHQSGTKTGAVGSKLLPDSGRQSLQRRFSGNDTYADAVDKLFAETSDPALTPSLQEWLIPEIQNQLKALGMQSLELPAVSPKVQSLSPRRLKVRSPKLHPYPAKDEDQVGSLTSAIKTSRILHSATNGSEDHFLDAKCKVVHSADELPNASSSDLMRRDDRYRQSWEKKADSEFLSQTMLRETVSRPSRDTMDAIAKGRVAANERVDVSQQFPSSAFGLNGNESLDSSPPSTSLTYGLADVRREELLAVGSQDAVYIESELRPGEGADAPSVPNTSTLKRDAVLKKPRGFFFRAFRGAAGYGKSTTSKAMQEKGPLDQEKLGQISNSGNATVSESDGEVYSVKTGATDVDSGSSSLHRIPVEAESAGDGMGDIEQSRVRVRVYKKSCKELADLRIMQKIKAHDGAIWTMAFNHDGRFLATAGRDCVVRVWEVASPPAPAGLSPVQSRHASPTKTSSEASVGGRLWGRSPGTSNQSIRNEKQTYAPSAVRNDPVRADASDLEREVGPSQEEDSHGIRRTVTSFTSFYLKDQPYQCYRGHTEQIADVAWAHDSNFLLSASMDKTVQLWHASTGDRLRKLEHSDYVTRVAFNPLNVKIFVSACLDQKVRVWNATNATMVAHADCKELLTAGAFQSDGLGVVVGSSQGMLKTYSVEGHDLKLTDKVAVRSSSGKEAVGPRIIGLECNRDLTLMTSNDSRLRVYNGTKLQCKYKGHKSTHTMTKAVFSPSGTHIACASEDSHVFVWSTSDKHDLHSRYSSKQKEKRQGHESFAVEQVTCTVFWPGYPTADEIVAKGAGGAGEQAGSRDSKEVNGSLFGAVIVTGSHNGEIQVYQNFGQPMAVKGDNSSRPLRG